MKTDFTKKTICINSLEKIKFLDKEWKDLDFIITTKEQLINISFEIYNQIYEQTNKHLPPTRQAKH